MKKTTNTEALKDPKKKLFERKMMIRIIWMTAVIIVVNFVVGGYLKKILEPQNVRDARAAFERGQAASNNNDYDSAIAEFTDAITLDPNKDIYYTNRGIIYQTIKKDYNKAIEDFTESIRVRAEVMKRKPVSIVFSFRGDCYFEKGEYIKGSADHTEAINIAPERNKISSYLSRAAFYSKTRDYRKAIEDYTEVIERTKKPSATLYYLRGHVYFERGWYPAAVTDFETALRLDPDDSITKEILAEARRRLGGK